MGGIDPEMPVDAYEPEIFKEVKPLVQVNMIFVDPKKAKEINNIWKAKIETEEFDKSILKTRKIIGLKEYLESPIIES
jgi:hypothetical protein